MAVIYVSSTYEDLKDHREAVYRALRQLGHDVRAMEDYVATDARPVDKCLRDVAAADLYLGIFAWRYGFVPDKDNPQGRSITESEYRHAVDCGKPRLIFLLHEDADWKRKFDDAASAQDKGEHIAALRTELKNERTVSLFTSTEELAQLASIAVANWEREARSTSAGLDVGARSVVQTGGAAYVGGNVDTGGGDFVGGNKYEKHTHHHALNATEQPEALLAAYYRSLAEECRRLPLGIIDSQFVSTRGEDAVPLTDIYVDLDVTAPRAPERGDEKGWAVRAVRGEGAERTPLLAALAAPDNARAVLLGDAGSGKTTFVNYLTWLLATQPASAPEALRRGVVVRLILREVAARHIPAGAGKGNAKMLWDALRDDMAARLDEASANSLYNHLHQRLLNEGGLILLDGLDEVPEAEHRRESLLGAVRDLAASLPGDKARLLLTARPYAYADPLWRLKKFSVLALAPFSPEQSEHFIQRFYQAVRPSTGRDEAAAGAHARKLGAALRDRPYLADLAARPLLLTLMATLHSSWGQLPEDRADLMEETVKLLLGRWQRGRESVGRDGQAVIEPGIAQCLQAGEGRIRSALEQLALAAHDRQGGAGAEDGEAADVTEGEVLVAFKPLLGTLAPEVLLAYLDQRAGLLILRRPGIYAFPHRSYQEFLAACQLSNQPGFAAALRERLRTDPKWRREVLLLGAGRVKRGGLGNVVALLNELLPEGPGEVPDRTDLHWQLASLTGQAMVETRLAESAAGQPASEALLRRCRQWLVDLVEGGHLPPRDRAEAGDILGQLEDPRFDPALFYLPARLRGQPEPFLGFVEVLAGPFVMGSRKGEKDTNDWELGNPPQLEIPYRYWIGRYPVTVAQYAVFVEDKGYENEDYWSANGWSWRRGQYDTTVEDEDLRKWLATRPAALRGQPMWWDELRRFPNRPVVGVCWFEAMAYAAWLHRQLQDQVKIPEDYALRLPTEAEWEKAARSGDGRRYPWGKQDWSEERANIFDSGIRHATPVGGYPAGATPSGCMEFAGNVWEWTRSLYRDYPYREDDGGNAPDAAGLRVLRGGSWFNDPWDARCAYRGRSDPGDFYNVIGFRVVVSLASSAF